MSNENGSLAKSLMELRETVFQKSGLTPASKRWYVPLPVTLSDARLVDVFGSSQIMLICQFQDGGIEASSDHRKESLFTVKEEVSLHASDSSGAVEPALNEKDWGMLLSRCQDMACSFYKR